jgi:hypothetical protein
MSQGSKLAVNEGRRTYPHASRCHGRCRPKYRRDRPMLWGVRLRWASICGWRRACCEAFTSLALHLGHIPGARRAAVHPFLNVMPQLQPASARVVDLLLPSGAGLHAPPRWRSRNGRRRLLTRRAQTISPATGLQHMRFVQSRDGQPFHRSGQIFAYFK